MFVLNVITAVEWVRDDGWFKQPGLALNQDGGASGAGRGRVGWGCTPSPHTLCEFSYQAAWIMSAKP